MKQKEEVIFGVYAIYHDKTLLYVGSSNDINRRFKEHKSRLKKGTNSKMLQKYVDEHQITPDDLKFVLLKETITDDKFHLWFAEMILINALKPLCNKAVIVQGRSMINLGTSEYIDLQILDYL